MRIKAAVIGCGNIGTDEKLYNKTSCPGTHAGAYSLNKDVELVALADSDPKKLKIAGKQFPKAKLFKNAEEMLREVLPDVVSIAVPTEYHKSLVLLAVRYRISAIICEKPIASSLSEAKEMIKMCKKSGSMLFINHQRHFDPLIIKWQRKILEGFLGKIYQADVYYSNGFFNNATHFVDLLLFFLRNPVSVSGKYNKLTSTKKNDPSIDGTLKFKNGAFATIHSLGKNCDFFDLRIFGEKGMLILHDPEFRLEYRKKVKSNKFKGYFEYSKKSVMEGKERSLMPAVIRHVVSCLRKKSKPLSTGDDGLKVFEILNLMKCSADNKSLETTFKRL